MVINQSVGCPSVAYMLRCEQLFLAVVTPQLELSDQNYGTLAKRTIVEFIVDPINDQDKRTLHDSPTRTEYTPWHSDQDRVHSMIHRPGRSTLNDTWVCR